MLKLVRMPREKPPTGDEIAAVLAFLREGGARVIMPRNCVQKNVEVDKDLWERVDAARRKRKIQIKRCVAEALEMWVSRQEESSD